MGLAGSAGIELYANVARFQEGMAKAGTQLGQFQGQLGAMQGHTRKLQNAFFNLAGAAAGVPGPIGKIAENLSLMTVGGPIAIGLAGVVLAISSIAKAAKEADAPLTAMVGRLGELSRITQRMQAMDALARYQRMASGGGVKGLAERRGPGVSEFDALKGLAADYWSMVFKPKLAGRDPEEDAKDWLAYYLTAMEALDRQTAGNPKLAATGKKIGKTLQEAIQEGFVGPDSLPDAAAFGPQWNILGGARDFNGPNNRGTSPNSAIEKATAVADQWEQAWVQAVRNIQDAVADLFVAMFTQAQNVLDIVRQLLLSLAKIAANLFAQKLISLAVGAINPGGTAAASASGGVNVTVNNAFALSAIEPAGMEAAIMAAYPAVTAATMRGMNESSAVSRYIRGW